jgi:hypothetical protein
MIIFFNYAPAVFRQTPFPAQAALPFIQAYFSANDEKDVLGAPKKV